MMTRELLQNVSDEIFSKYNFESAVELLMENLKIPHNEASHLAVFIKHSNPAYWSDIFNVKHT